MVCCRNRNFYNSTYFMLHSSNIWYWTRLVWRNMWHTWRRMWITNYFIPINSHMDIYTGSSNGLRSGNEQVLLNLSFYICTVIDSFCFLQPKRHNLRLCYVWPVAAKLVDNKTLFCHSERAKRRGISMTAEISHIRSKWQHCEIKKRKLQWELNKE